MTGLFSWLGLAGAPAHVPAAGSDQTLFAETCAAEALAAAWAKVKANGGTAGGDDMTVPAFAQNAAHHLARLRQGLITGRYRPGPLRRVTIPKPGGGERGLAIPCVADRVVQTAAARCLGRLLDQRFSSDSYAYRPGRSVEEAVTRIAVLRRSGYVWTVDGDIRKFFDRVRHANVVRMLAARVTDRPFIALVRTWLGQTWEPGIGLPQGLPISPILANLALDGVDHDITAWPRCRWVRYADDFLLLCRSRQDAVDGLQRLHQRLRREGLELHPQKTRIVAPHEPLTFLGYRLATESAPPPGRGYPSLPRGQAWASLTDVSAATSAPPPLRGHPVSVPENPYGPD